MYVCIFLVSVPVLYSQSEKRHQDQKSGYIYIYIYICIYIYQGVRLSYRDMHEGLVGWVSPQEPSFSFRKSICSTRPLCGTIF